MGRVMRVSLLAWSLLTAPLFAAPPQHGDVTQQTLTSKLLGAERRFWVYTPPGYASSGPDNDLLLVFDGREYLEDFPLPAILDTLIAQKKLPPTVAVMMDNGTGAERLADLGNHEAFADFVGAELIPWVRGKWKVSSDPHRATIAGSSAGGLAAAFVALRHPEIFANVLSQSGAFWRGAEGSNEAPFEWVTQQHAASPKRDIRFFLDVGSTESAGAIGGTAPSILEANRRFRDVLAAKRYELHYYEVPGGRHAVETWRDRLPVGLEWLARRRRL